MYLDSSSCYQVSMLKGVAETFNLLPFSDILAYGPVEADAPETELTFIEVINISIAFI